MIDLTLAQRIHSMADRVPFPLQIVSGFRSTREQEDLRKEADSTAALSRLSTHTSCPATGADLTPSVAANDDVKIRIGEAAFVAQLRWGGGAPRDRNGVPVGVEWRHVDLGPRQFTTGTPP